jgi:hypothetical protein
MGKMVDMEALASKNEHTRAVGNMPVNARGDIIDGMGKIIKPMTARVNEMYAQTIGNPTAQVKRKTAPPTPAPKIDLPELTEFERELEDNLAEEIEIEKIKTKSTKK